VASGSISLAAKSYIPPVNARPGGGVVMLHGISSSSDVFDVPGDETLGLARRIAAAGLHAIAFDQRGAGDSPVTDWRFGLRDHAVIDLPAVLADCRSRFGLERVVLLGHSLGGTVWLTYMESGASASPGQPAIAGGIAIGSPPEFDRAMSPWKEIAARGRPFVESLDRNRDLIVAREEFVAGQIWLYWPRLKWLFLPGGVKLSLKAGAAWRPIAGLLRRLRIPTLVYLPDDFDTPTFQRVLRSRMLDSASTQLFLELADFIFGELPPARPPMPLDVLGIGSASDRLVPLHTLQGFAKRFTPARILATEEAYGQHSGHIGYFFRASIRDRVAEDVIAHALRTLA
jgi:pimeloyl-ACP methyl ester carboxylesterase